MSVGLYADVHVPGTGHSQLRLRGVDVLAATEEGTNQLKDRELLAVSTSQKRVLVTQDIRFRVMAEEWQRTGKSFAGLIFGHQRHVSFGQMVFDLELVAKTTDSDYWQNRVEQLPI